MSYRLWYFLRGIWIRHFRFPRVATDNVKCIFRNVEVRIHWRLSFNGFLLPRTSRRLTVCRQIRRFFCVFRLTFLYCCLIFIDVFLLSLNWRIIFVRKALFWRRRKHLVEAEDFQVALFEVRWVVHVGHLTQLVSWMYTYERLLSRTQGTFVARGGWFLWNSHCKGNQQIDNSEKIMLDAIYTENTSGGWRCKDAAHLQWFSGSSTDKARVSRCFAPIASVPRVRLKPLLHKSLLGVKRQTYTPAYVQLSVALQLITSPTNKQYRHSLDIHKIYQHTGSHAWIITFVLISVGCLNVCPTFIR